MPFIKSLGGLPFISVNGTQPAVYNPVPPRTGNDLVTLNGTHDGTRTSFGLTEELLKKHLLLVGSTGCGKTTTFVRIVNQLQARMTHQDVMIIFDSKGDYAQKIQVSGQRLFIANSAPYRSQSVVWNLFKEIIPANYAQNPPPPNLQEEITNATQEICRSLFMERTKKTNNPFFPNAARDLLAALIISLIRAGLDPSRDPYFIRDFWNNKGLIDFLNSRDSDEFCRLLDLEPDLHSIRSYLGGGGDQAYGVLSEMYSVVRDVLTGAFAQAPSRQKPSFSMRNFVRERGNKTLFIEYDTSLGSSLLPVYRLLIDLALKESLSQSAHNSATSQGNVYIICDELRLLPYLDHIDDGVNFGRSLGVKIIAGLQSIEQLFEVYQESRGRNIAAGFSTLIAYHSTDPSTIEYIRKAYGDYEIREQYTDPLLRNTEYRRRGPVIDSWDLVNLDVGEAFICPAFGVPFSFKFEK